MPRPNFDKLHSASPNTEDAQPPAKGGESPTQKDAAPVSTATKPPAQDAAPASPAAKTIPQASAPVAPKNQCQHPPAPADTVLMVGAASLFAGLLVGGALGYCWGRRRATTALKAAPPVPPPSPAAPAGPSSAFSGSFSFEAPRREAEVLPQPRSAPPPQTPRVSPPPAPTVAPELTPAPPVPPSGEALLPALLELVELHDQLRQCRKPEDAREVFRSQRQYLRDYWQHRLAPQDGAKDIESLLQEFDGELLLGTLWDEATMRAANTPSQQPYQFKATRRAGLRFGGRIVRKQEVELL